MSDGEDSLGCTEEASGSILEYEVDCKGGVLMADDTVVDTVTAVVETLRLLSWFSDTEAVGCAVVTLEECTSDDEDPLGCTRETD